MFDTYIGTTGGVYRLCDGAIEPLGLTDERIWAMHAWRAGGALTIHAGSYGNGMYRSEDGGATWSPANTGLTATAFRYIGPDPLHPGAILAGTEPGRLFRSADGGRTWQELAGITDIAGYEQWFLPYSPRAGAIRNVYAPPGNASRLFASVEVGGLLRSDDGGATWTCAPVIEDDDIHFITGHPQDPNLLYAALGYAALPHHRNDDAPRRFGGIARSRDGGTTWEKLESDYTRGTHPANAARSRPRRAIAAGRARWPDRRLVGRWRHLGTGQRGPRYADARHGGTVRRRTGWHRLGRLFRRSAAPRHAGRMVLALGAARRCGARGPVGRLRPAPRVSRGRRSDA